MTTNEAPGERIRATSGRIMGPVSVVLGLGAFVGAVWDRSDTVWVVAGFGLVLAALGWGSMIRPALWLGRDHLTMRGMFTTVTVPLAAIESASVRQVLEVHAGDRRFTSSVLGRSRRTVARSGMGSGLSGKGATQEVEPEPQHPSTVEHVAHMEDQIDRARMSARDRAGVRLASKEQLLLAEQVERRIDVVPVVLVGGALVFLVVSYFL